MTPPKGHRHEHAEHGVRNRIIACRQRLRRIRAAHKASDSLSDGQPLMTDELLIAAGEGAGGIERVGLLPDAEAFNRYVERRR